MHDTNPHDDESPRDEPSPGAPDLRDSPDSRDSRDSRESAESPQASETEDRSTPALHALQPEDFPPDSLDILPPDPEAFGRMLGLEGAASDDPYMTSPPEGFRAGWIALLGPPNVGKSTLLNALVGQKVAIVTSKPQTTRTQVTGILSLPEAQAVFYDTPGIHQRGGAMNRALLQAAWQALSGASLVTLVLDMAFATARPEAFFAEVETLRLPVLEAGRPVLLALNKVDVVKPKDALLPLMERLGERFPEATLFPISALNKTGLEPLLAAMLAHLPESPPLFPPDQVSTVPMRFMAAELVREKLFIALRQELPYSLAVDVESWEEDPAGERVTIHAVVYVSRKAHKGMVIGKGGALLKEVGAATRKELNEMLDQRVHLEIWVKVKENWTENPAMLRQLGYM